MMDNDMIGKGPEFALSAPNDEAIVKRSKPTLVLLGTRLIPSDSRFHPDLAAEYVRDHGGRTRWIPIGELARVFYGGNTPSNKDRIRKRLCLIWRALLAQGFLLVIEVGGSVRLRAQACKLYDARSWEERQYLRLRFERMEKVKILRIEQLARAQALAQCLDAAAVEQAG